MEDSNESYEIIETEEIVEVEETQKVDQDKTNTVDTNETGKIKVDNRESMNMTREELAKFKPMPLPTINLIDNTYDRSTNLVAEFDPVTGKKFEKNVQISTNIDVVNVNQGSLAQPTLTAFKPIDLEKFKPGSIDIQTNINQNNNTQIKETVIKKQMPAINLDAFKMGNYKNLADKDIDLENTKGEKVDEVMTKEISKNAELEKIAKLEEEERLRMLKLEEEEREREKQRELERQRDLKRKREQELEDELERQRERERREALERENQARKLKELEIEAELARLKQIEEQDRLRKQNDEERERERLRKLQDIEDEKRRQQREAEERERQRKEEEARRKKREEEERKRRDDEERRRREEEDRRRREEELRRLKEDEDRLARERALAKTEEMKDYKVDETFSRSQVDSHEKYIINNVKNNLFNGDESIHSYSEKSMTNEQRDEMLKNVLGVVGAILFIIFIIAMLKAFVFPAPMPIPIPVPVAGAAAGSGFPAGFYTSMRAIGVGGYGPAGMVVPQPPIIVATVAAPAMVAGAPAVGKSLGVQTNTVGNNGNPSTFTDTDHSVNSNVGTLVKQNSQLTHTVEHKNNVNIIQGGGHPHSPHSHGPTIVNNYNQPVHHSHYINIYTHDDKSATLMAHNVHSADMSNTNTNVVSQSQSQTKTEAPVAIATSTSTSTVQNPQPILIDTPSKKEEEKKPAETPKEEPKIIINVPKEEPKIIVNVPKEESKPMNLNLNINLDQKFAHPQEVKVEKVIEPNQTEIEIPIKIEQEVPQVPEPVVPPVEEKPKVIEEIKPPEDFSIQTTNSVANEGQPTAKKIQSANFIHESIVHNDIPKKIEEPQENKEKIPFEPPIENSIKETKEEKKELEKPVFPPVTIDKPLKEEKVEIIEVPPAESKQVEIVTKIEEQIKPFETPLTTIKEVDVTETEEDKMLKDLDEKYKSMDSYKKDPPQEESQSAIEIKIKEKEKAPEPPVQENRIVVSPQKEAEVQTSSGNSENVRNIYHFHDYNTEHHVVIPHKVIIPNEAVYKHHAVYKPDEDVAGTETAITKGSIKLRNEERIKHSEGVLNSFVRGEDQFNRYKNLQSMFGGVPEYDTEDGQAPKQFSEDDLSITHQIDKPSIEDTRKITKRARTHFKIAAASNEKLTTHAAGVSQEPVVVAVPVTIEGTPTPCEQLEAQKMNLHDGLI